jgi:hypothetical protein
MAANTSVPTVWAQRLGFGGLIPFVGLALALWVLAPAQRSVAGLALLGYGATIASFLGAIYWGLLMRDASTPSPRLLVWGVVPCLVAWLGLLLAPVPGLLLMAGLLWTCFGVDRAMYPRFQMQGWLPMRLVLTVVASASCVAGAVALWR